MPIAIRLDPQDRIWTMTTGETFTFDEVVDLVEKTDWSHGSLYLWDLQKLLSGPSSSIDIRRAADLAKQGIERWSGSRAAIVVARDVDFGIARMFQTYAEDAEIEYQIFRDLGEARDWLLSSPDS